ncbi:MAG TPA: SIMPL domain-containing protein [Candidatus Saccharimonadales bacterium]|nr:SIMPL domain-containing protein [Candidatus Saccharimonadales bacterium]
MIASTTNHKQNVTVDLRIVVILLLVVIAAMLFIWKPWAGSGISSRTVEAAGETTVKATPDEFAFYPTYEFKNTDKAAALAELTKKSDELVAELKELGVPSNKIKTNSSGYNFPVYYQEKPGEITYTLQLTVTVANQALAQKVQDYLVTTTPTGNVSPAPNFSEKKRKELEATARNEATKDARTKAEQMGKNLGFRLGKVKAVAEGDGFNVMPYMDGRATTMAIDSKPAAAPELAVQPGENELTYTVKVTYFIK